MIFNKTMETEYLKDCEISINNVMVKHKQYHLTYSGIEKTYLENDFIHKFDLKTYVTCLMNLNYIGMGKFYYQNNCNSSFMVVFVSPSFFKYQKLINKIPNISNYAFIYEAYNGALKEFIFYKKLLQ